MHSHCAFCFYTILFYLQTISFTIQAGKLRIERWCDWDVLNTAEPWSAHRVAPPAKKSGKKAVRFWHIAGDFENLQYIKSYSKWRNTQTPSPVTLLEARSLTWGRNRSTAVLACLLLIQRSSWYCLQFLKMPGTFCFNELYLLIFACWNYKI